MFKEALDRIVERTEGAVGAIIMGTDGIAVEKSFRAASHEINIDVAVAELTSLIRNAQRMGRDTGLGSLHEQVLVLDRVILIARLFTHEYFVALALERDGNIGRGRFELRKAELELAPQFSV